MSVILATAITAFGAALGGTLAYALYGTDPE